MAPNAARWFVAAALAVIASDLRAAPCAEFNDVDETNDFCTVIEWVRNRSITLGCVADGSLYCPADYVRRDQMAAFLWRLGVQNAFLNGGNAFGAPASLGTGDNFAIELKANNQRVARFEPDLLSPNLVAGHAANVAASGSGQTVGGGGMGGSDCVDPATGTNVRACRNATGSGFATVGGGYANQASGGSATVGGGDSNTAGAFLSTVGGGQRNRALGSTSTVGGGYSHLASGQYSTVVGGEVNTASGSHSVVGGDHNTASGASSTVSGGAFNVASGNYAAVPGGVGNEARGDYSVALGRNAIVTAGGDGSFVFSDGDSASFTSSSPNQFLVGASGGIGFYTNKNLSTYCRLGIGGGTWDCSSSRHVKRDFASVDPRSVLASVAALPITTWRFAGEPPDVRHLGPMAQDFRAAFGLGTDAESISQVDINGVALAAIQGLHRQLRDRETELAVQRTAIAALEARLSLLEASVATRQGR